MDEDKGFYKDIIDNLNDGVYFVDRERVITYWNKGAERITGYTSQQAVGRSCRDNLLNHVTADGDLVCLSQCPLAACMEDGTAREAYVFLHHADGHRIPVWVRAAPLRDAQGNIIGSVEIFTANTEMMTLRYKVGELRRALNTDKLTGIGNRQFIEGRLHALIAEKALRTDTVAGLLFIDIDHFKQINDTYGHDFGDKVLVMVAQTVQHNLRKSDVLGRWGGEEFIAILYDVETFQQLKSIADKLRVLVEFSRLDLPGASLSVTISIGATFLLPIDTPESIVSRADELMYQSKRNGRNQVSLG